LAQQPALYSAMAAEVMAAEEAALLAQRRGYSAVH